jgi:uncharacterized membrane protein YcjF (UPF0283 family)
MAGKASHSRGPVERQPTHRPSDSAAVEPSEPASSEHAPVWQTEVSSAFQVIRWLYSLFAGPTTVAVAWAVGGLVALYIYLQILSVVATIASFPTWLAMIAFLFLGLLTLVVVVAIGRLIWAYLRLRRNLQIRISDREILQRHEQIRRASSRAEQHQQARSLLEAYVRAYPDDPIKKGSPNPGATPGFFLSPAYPSQAPQFSEEQLGKLHDAKQRLIDPRGIEDTKEWLRVFATEFQAVLDAAARDRVHQCAQSVAIKTAISPNAFVDTLIAVYWCFVLLRDLCTIYNVRVGGYGTAALLWRVFLTVYVVGKLEEWEEAASETVESLVSGLPDIIQNTVGKLVSMVAPKVAAGTASYLMVRRVGMRAIALLRPLVIERS